VRGPYFLIRFRHGSTEIKRSRVEYANELANELTVRCIDAKANKDMAEKAKGKGPMNAGQQGIKKSGKK